MAKKADGAGTVNWIYEIRVEGQLSREWSSWFDGLAIEHELNHATGNIITVITGNLPDQAALHGIFNKIRDLNLTILSCLRKP